MVELTNCAINEQYTGEELWPEWLDDWGGDKLMDMLAQLETWKRRLTLVETEIKKRLTDIIGEGGRIHDGHTFYRYAAPRKRVAYDKRKVFALLGEDAAECFHIDDMLITAFRGVIRKRAEEEGSESPDGYVEMVEESLFDFKPRGRARLEKTIMDKAPKYALEMEPGEIRKGRPK
jgi:hypothetical protein